jgi:hypothetical protein
MAQCESLDSLNDRIEELDREQNDYGDRRNVSEIKRLLVAIREAEKREKRLSPYLRWLYIGEDE